ELATSINLGRQVAISRNTTVCVEVASLTNIRLRTGGCGGAIWTGPGTDGSGAIKISDSSTLQISTTANVVFTNLGAASPAGTYTLTNPVNNGTRTVVVAATGRVSVRGDARRATTGASPSARSSWRLSFSPSAWWGSPLDSSTPPAAWSWVEEKRPRPSSPSS